MTIALRRTVFLDGERRPDDYEVRHNGRTIGRILRLRSTSRELWRWTQIGWGPTYGPNGGNGHTRRGQSRVPPDLGRLRRI